MIPTEQLSKLKPLQDIVNRELTMKGKLKHHKKKFHLTKQQRNFAEFPMQVGSKKISSIKHFREYRRLPKMEEREKK